MRPRKRLGMPLLATVLCGAAFCSAVFAKAAKAPLETKVAESDLIAVVQIISIEKLEPEGRYSSVAQVKVEQSIKGLSSGETFELEFDNGLICPNISYQQGETCLLFATKLANGHYATYNTYFGKFDVKNDKARYWTETRDEYTALSAVVTQINKFQHK